jgi:hypothetical protein
MTPQTQKDMAELGLNEATLAERQAKVQAIVALAAEAPRRAKKPRSDKGKPRVKAPEPVAGALTDADISRIKDFFQSISDARDNLAAAQDRLDALEEERDAFLASKKAK